MNINKYFRIIFFLLSFNIIFGAEVLPDIPNPYGFDDRLALLSFLQENYSYSPKGGESIEELRNIFMDCAVPGRKILKNTLRERKLKYNESDSTDRLMELVDERKWSIESNSDIRNKIDDKMSCIVIQLQRQFNFNDVSGKSYEELEVILNNYLVLHQDQYDRERQLNMIKFREDLNIEEERRKEKRKIDDQIKAKDLESAKIARQRAEENNRPRRAEIEKKLMGKRSDKVLELLGSPDSYDASKRGDGSRKEYWYYRNKVQADKANVGQGLMQIIIEDGVVKSIN